MANCFCGQPTVRYSCLVLHELSRLVARRTRGCRRTLSHVWLLPTLGTTAVSRRAEHELQSGLSGSQTTGLACLSTRTMPCPRVRGWLSRTNRSNERWATVGMHIPYGQGLGASGSGYRLSRSRGNRLRVRLAESSKRGRTAIEAACLQRFGTVCPVDAPVLRSDNELIFQSRQFREAHQGYRLRQKFTRPTRRSRMASSSGSFTVSSHSGRATVIQPRAATSNALNVSSRMKSSKDLFNGRSRIEYLSMHYLLRSPSNH